MSLTSFIRRPDVARKFSEEFPRLPVPRKTVPIAPPLTKNYGVVGTAFDYLLRLYIKRLNQRVRFPIRVINEKEGWRWATVEGAQIKISTRFPLAAEGAKLLVSTRARNEAHRILLEAEKLYDQYLETGKINRRLLKIFLGIAQLEIFFRAGIDIDTYDPMMNDRILGKYDECDVKDLSHLLSLVKPKIFKAKYLLVFNPTFGKASHLMGGADADIIIDDMLLEIKTTKEMRVTRRMYNQLIGYYTLAEIGGIAGLEEKHRINKLGIYFSRFAELYTIHVEDTIDKKRFATFVRWFRGRARREPVGFF